MVLRERSCLLPVSGNSITYHFIRSLMGRCPGRCDRLPAWCSRLVKNNGRGQIQVHGSRSFAPDYARNNPLVLLYD